MGLVSSIFAFLAPWLSWMTITLTLIGVYQHAYEADLLQIYSHQIIIGISQTLGYASLGAAFLLIGAGALGLKTTRIAIGVEAAGVALFLFPAFSVFKYLSNGSTSLLYSPGFGLILSCTGILFGALSLRTKKQPLRVLYAHFKTRVGAHKTGLFLASTSIALSGLNLASRGQLTDFLGESLLEILIHLGIILPLLLLVVAFVRWGSGGFGPWTPRLVALSFLFLFADTAYHIVGGSLSGFLGPTWLETTLNLATYTGIILLVISWFFLEK